MRPARARPARTLLLAGAVSIGPPMLTGCASSRPPSPLPATPAADAAQATHSQRARDRLRELVAIEANRPAPLTDAVADLPKPASLERVWIRRPGSGSLHDLSLEAVLDDLIATAGLDREPGSTADTDRRPDDSPVSMEATRAYVLGRQLLAGGDAETAVNELRRASNLEPDSIAALRALAAALRAVGRDTESVKALERTVELGSRRPADLWRLAVATRAGGLPGRSAALLAAALRDGGPIADPGLWHLVRADLGRDLIELGYTGAARGPLLDGLFLPDRFSSRSSFSVELIALQGELTPRLAAASDAFTDANDPETALRLYERAADRPDAPRWLIAHRLVWLRAAMNQPAHAAETLLESADRPAFRLDERLIELAELLRPTPEIAKLIEASIQRERDTRTARSWRARLAAATFTLPRELDALEDLIAEHPDDPAAITRLVRLAIAQDPAAGVSRVVTTAEKLPASARSIASALAIIPPARSEIVRALADDARPMARTLGARLAVADGDPAAADRILAEAGDPARDPFTLGLAVEVAAALGQWDRAESLAARFDDLAASGRFDPLDTALAEAEAFAMLHRPDRALAALDPWLEDLAEENTNASDRASLARVLRARALIARRFGPQDAGLRSWRRLHALDPDDTQALEGLAQSLALDPAAAQSPERFELFQTAQRRYPFAPAIRLLRARELARLGRTHDAEAEARSLALERPWEPAQIDLLVSLWTASSDPAQRRADAERGLAWILERLEARPETVHLVSAAVRLHGVLGQPDQAESLIISARRRHDSDALQRLHEQLLAALPGRTADLMRLRDERLASPATAIGGALETAAFAVEKGDPVGAARAVTAALPPDARLTLPQRDILARLTEAVAGQASNAPTNELVGPALELLDTTIARSIELRPVFYRIRLGLLTEMPSADPARFARAYRDAVGAGQADQLRLAVVRSLVQQQRAREALDVLPALASESPEPAAEDYLAWMQLIGMTGGADDARRLIDAIASVDSADSPGLLASLLTQAFGMGIEIPEDSPGQRAELAYRLSALAAAQSRDAASDDLLRLALEFDADHPWANNDLGYRLAERGEDLDAASRLLERAFNAEPENANILDSLGWVRYRLGIIADRPASEDAGPMDGAVTLLGRAIEIAGDRASPTMRRQFGDALWRFGNTEEAIAQWLLAEETLAGRAEQVMGDPGVPEAVAGRVLDELQQIRARISSIRTGLEPPVAPLLGEPAGETAEDHDSDAAN